MRIVDFKVPRTRVRLHVGRARRPALCNVHARRPAATRLTFLVEQTLGKVTR